MTIFHEIKLATQALAKPHDPNVRSICGSKGKLCISLEEDPMYILVHNRFRRGKRERDEDRAFGHEVVTKMAEAVTFCFTLFHATKPS